MGYRTAIEIRFWDKVVKSDECWEWQGAHDPRGYGFIGAPGGGKNLLAHRVSWELHNGAIPQGRYVLHRCDNPRCVRPDHLFLGTHADNMADRQAKGRQAQGDGQGQRLHPEAYAAAHAGRKWQPHPAPDSLARGDRHWSKTHPERVARGEGKSQSKFTDDQIREIRAWAASAPRKQRPGGGGRWGPGYGECAARYGVNEATIRDIVQRKTWAHVE